MGDTTFEGKSSPTHYLIDDSNEHIGAIKGSLQNVGTTQKILATKRRSFISKRQSELNTDQQQALIDGILKPESNDEAEEHEDVDLERVLESRQIYEAKEGEGEEDDSSPRAGEAERPNVAKRSSQ